MAVIKSLLDHPVAEWVGRMAIERLSGKARACAVNARNHLVRAQMIVGISTTVSYFCATHATEEAVAAFIASAKNHGYRKLAGNVNVHDHAQKAVVSAYAQLVSGLAEDAGLAIAHNPAGDDLRVRVKSGDKTTYDSLSLGLFSFNEDHEDLTFERAHLAFTGMFPDIGAMVKRVQERAGFREKALYAQNGGAPDMSREQLDINLREHTPTDSWANLGRDRRSVSQKAESIRRPDPRSYIGGNQQSQASKALQTLRAAMSDTVNHHFNPQFYLRNFNAGCDNRQNELQKLFCASTVGAGDCTVNHRLVYVKSHSTIVVGFCVACATLDGYRAGPGYMHLLTAEGFFGKKSLPTDRSRKV